VDTIVSYRDVQDNDVARETCLSKAKSLLVCSRYLDVDIGFSATESRPDLVLITVATLQVDDVSDLNKKSPVAGPNIDGWP
jgi:hypothetical protein